MKYLKGIISALILVALDQLTKYLVLLNVKPVGTIPIVEGVLSLTYHENRGAVWGIMQGQIPILIVTTLIILVGVLWLYGRIPDEARYLWLRIIGVLVIAGAIGNFIDRIFRHYVVDFIYFELINFPIFNVADMYVVIAAALLIITVIFIYKDEHDFDFILSKKGEHNE
ncbi:MAG: signal peptidase II [Clostridia bacterium]|nr:signal peptidase II [Lachnospiraceae bacterium]NCC00632.1 signal peptidase II [Clostridia bacterium]